tara:strand:+ start:80 stop:466 length:387 start_codon:yes stop_codon:yes gene_type:complete
MEYVILFLLFLIFIILIWGLPIIIAFKRNHELKTVITILTIFAPIGGVTWVIALVLAVFPRNRALGDPIIENRFRNTGERVPRITYGEYEESRSQKMIERRRRVIERTENKPRRVIRKIDDGDYGDYP